MDENKKQKILLRIAVMLAIALFLSIGFVFGRITSKEFKCSKNPFIYGIKLFNEANEDNYKCNCYGKASFSFNEDHINLEGTVSIITNIVR